MTKITEIKSPNPLVNEVIDYAKRFIGIPYKYAGNNPLTGFDCSGFVCEIMKGFGLLLYHEDLDSKTLYVRFNRNGKDLERKSQTGCLLFFGREAASINHVAIGLGESHMIEAGGGGSNVVDVKIAARANAFVRIRPINRTVYASIMPPYERG